MNKIIIGIIIALSLIFFLALISSSPEQPNSTTNNQESKVSIKADKIEVVHFHASQQCWSCITVGKYAFKTIKERFPEEYTNGTITFRDVNGELLENKELVIKYQAGGSSLFINAISNGKDHIEEDINVWRFVNNEASFINYFEKKLKELLKS